MHILVQNKKATFNYEIGERLEAGIELLGHEVKSLRGGHASLDGSYIYVKNGEAFLKGMRISPYQQGNVPEEHNPERDRRILLTKAEISRISEPAKGLTIVPILVYNKARKIKLEIGIGRGKKKFDKRETLKKRTTERDIRRELSDR
jgi:SsrA-binding protein